MKREIPETKEEVAKAEEEIEQLRVLASMKPEIKEILQDPKFLEKLNQELNKWIVGEEDSRFTILLCSLGRFVENQHQSSFNLLVNDESGVGKDWITKHTLDISPEKHIVSRKSITPKVWRYWHNAKFEPDWTWNNRVCYLEDVSNSVLNDETFKVMCSSGNSTTTVVINQRVFDVIVQGKPIMVVTSANANPSKEQLRRFTILNLNEGTDQSKAIMKRHSKYAAEGLVPEYDINLIEAQECLRRVKVKIPYAMGLDEFFPDSVISRTAYPRFLDYIKASVAVNQFQRKIDDNGYYLANNVDYENARRAFMQTTSNRALIPHTKNQKRVLEIIRECFPNEWFTLRDIELKVNFVAERQLNRLLHKLTGDFLEISEETDKERLAERNAKKPFLKWKFKDVSNFTLPSWEELLKDGRFTDNLTNMTLMTIKTYMTNMTN